MPSDQPPAAAADSGSARPAGGFSDWIGRTETTADELAPAQARAAAALFDEQGGSVPADGAPLPPLWHWFHFLPCAPQGQLGTDGHAERGGFLPPIPLPRRMFAGATLEFHHPLQLGRPALRQAVIRDVALKSGRAGALAFVTVALRIEQDGRPCLTEEQQIVYREAGGPVPAPPVRPFAATGPGQVVQDLLPDTRLLFRFSALTFNAHRIHYDRDYATAAEGYPSLVVHGPLTAMLLLRLAIRATGLSPRDVASFSFRALAPLFEGQPLRLQAVPGADGATALQALRCDGTVAMQAQAVLRG
jgi:3-methylfumaryl-CoA hydratase